MAEKEYIECGAFTDTEKELYRDIWDGLGIQDYADECIWKKARVENCALSLSKKGYRKHIKIPAADVVEVVRCKDCKHKLVTTSGRVMCKRNARKIDCVAEWCGLTATNDDAFCNYGERKGGA